MTEKALGFELEARKFEPEEKETHKDILVRLGFEATLWHDPDHQSFATFETNGHRENHLLRAKAFKAWLRYRFYLETEKAPGSQAMEDALGVLEARAMFFGEERQTYVRIAQVDQRIYIDLGTEDWSVIQVSSEGWRVISDPPVAFIRSRSMRPLPSPEKGSVLELRSLLNSKSDDDFKVVVAWVMAALRPSGPFPILCLNGEQGSGKSTEARVLRRLVDPNAADTRTTPRDETDLLVAARNGWVISLDNLSVVNPWLADALCRLSTGGGFGARQLYTNVDEVVFEAKRPIIINGIPTLATRPDLGDRCYLRILPTISETEKWDEDTFWEAFEDCKGRILGGILDCAAHALKTSPAVRAFCKENRVPRPRMADAAIWAGAALGAVGWDPIEIIALLVQNQANVQKHIADADLVVNAIHQFMEIRTDWEGTTTELLKQVREILPEEIKKARDWPKGANAFSGRLRRAAPGLRITGIGVHERYKDGITRWHLNKISRGKDPTYATLPTSEPAQQGDKWAKWDGFQAESYEDRKAAYKREERLAIQNEPPLSPETREANRVLGDLPSHFDRRESREAKNGR